MLVQPLDYNVSCQGSSEPCPSRLAPPAEYDRCWGLFEEYVQHCLSIDNVYKPIDLNIARPGHKALTGYPRLPVLDMPPNRLAATTTAAASTTEDPFDYHPVTFSGRTAHFPFPAIFSPHPTMDAPFVPIQGSLFWPRSHFHRPDEVCCTGPLVQLAVTAPRHKSRPTTSEKKTRSVTEKLSRAPGI